MQHKFSTQVILLSIVVTLAVSGCSTFAPTPVPTDTPQPTITDTLVPTATLTPTRTPRPTSTPNLTATQKAQEFQAEVQSYFDNGYLDTTVGRIQTFGDFASQWAQLGWYRRFWLDGSGSTLNRSDFAFNAHFRWSSAYRNADISGCGVAFAIQPNDDHYAVFLDRSKVLFVKTDYYYDAVGPTRGPGRVQFENPFDTPAEADFTLIVRDTNAYVLVNEELVGEYTLAESRGLKGQIMLAMISGTNKDFGTRCGITNIHIFIPD